MNKTDLILEIANNSDLDKAQAKQALDGFVQAVTQALKRGDEVNITGFGAFKTSDRAASKGRNPRTGEPIEISAKTLSKFTPGKELKEAAASRQTPKKPKSRS